MTIYFSQPKKSEQTPEEKERLRKAAEALFLEIDSEFGKKKPGQKPVKAIAAKPVQPSEGKEANRISMLMGQDSVWKPVGRVAHLVTQICKCCKGEQEFLGNTLIRHQHKTRGYLWDCQLPADPSHTSLPQIVNTTTIYIDECPACLRFDMHVQELTTENFQLHLFS